MKIWIDSREQENTHILKTFTDAWADKQIDGFEQNKTIIIGDYKNPDNPAVWLERKNSWQEFAGNCGSNHDRFKRELERLDQTGGKLFILVEELTPLENWKGRHTKMKGNVIQKIIETWKTKHNIEIVQVDKRFSGQKIIEILKGGI
jgi:hypothetical protein